MTNMKNIRVGVITATRAEYGLLRPLIIKLREYECESFKADLIVTGTHLSSDYGMTINEILQDDVRIDYKVPIPVNSFSPIDISTNQSVALIEFTKLFSAVKYDAIYILGDRYEILMVAIAAMNTHIPIMHLCGGDTTEGAIDEAIRHSITKMSFLHFPSNEDSKRRIIQLGENPDRVYNVGDLAVDNFRTMQLMTKTEILREIGVEKWIKNELCDIQYALCTYHPVTLGDKDVEDLMDNFLLAIGARPNIEFIVTKSNSDMGGGQINDILDEAQNRLPNLHVYSSLGVYRYLSAMKWAMFVIGNSSSGLHETPIMRIPTINIGDRQKGRLRCESVIDCLPDKKSILNAIDKACSEDFVKICKNMSLPYGDGHTAEKIAAISINEIKKNINLKKEFYDLDIYNRE